MGKHFMYHLVVCSSSKYTEVNMVFLYMKCRTPTDHFTFTLPLIIMVFKVKNSRGKIQDNMYRSDQSYLVCNSWL